MVLRGLPRPRLRRRRPAGAARPSRARCSRTSPRSPRAAVRLAARRERRCACTATTRAPSPTPAPYAGRSRPPAGRCGGSDGAGAAGGAARPCSWRSSDAAQALALATWARAAASRPRRSCRRPAPCSSTASPTSAALARGWPRGRPARRRPGGAGRGAGRLRRRRPRVRRRALGHWTSRTAVARHARDRVRRGVLRLRARLRLPGRAAGGAAPSRGWTRPRTRVPAGLGRPGRRRGAGSTRRRRRAAGGCWAAPTPCCGTPTASEPALLRARHPRQVRAADERSTCRRDAGAADHGPGPGPVRPRAPRRPPRGCPGRAGRRARQPAGRQRRRTPRCSRSPGRARSCTADAGAGSRSPARRAPVDGGRRRRAARRGPSGCRRAPAAARAARDRGAVLRRGRGRDRGRAGARLARRPTRWPGSARRGSRPATVLPVGEPAGAARAARHAPAAARRARCGSRRGRAPTGSPTTRSTVLCGTPYAVRADSNRIGLRLDGAAAGAGPRAASWPARGWCSAPSRCRPSGRPVVFLADHPPTGGYPVIGVVDDRRPVAVRAAAAGRRGAVHRRRLRLRGAARR